MLYKLYRLTLNALYSVEYNKYMNNTNVIPGWLDCK